MSRRRLILLGMGALLVGSAIMVWQMTRMAPTWYGPPDATDTAVIQFADRVEYNLVQQAQQVRLPDDRWTLRIREEQINAWLSARLRKWITRDDPDAWPDRIGVPQAHLQHDAIDIAIPLLDGDRTRYLIARIKPAIVAGSLRLELDRVALGRISLPGEPLANLLDSLSKAAPSAMSLTPLNTAIQWLERREAIDPVFDLADGRRVRVLDLQLNHGVIDITAQTLPDHR